MRYKDQILNKLNAVSNALKTMKFNSERGFIGEVRKDEEKIQDILEEINSLIEIQENHY